MNADKIPDIIIGRLPIYLQGSAAHVRPGDEDHVLAGTGRLCGHLGCADPQGHFPVRRVRQAGHRLFHPVPDGQAARDPEGESHLGCGASWDWATWDTPWRATAALASAASAWHCSSIPIPAKIGQKVGNFIIEDAAQLVERVRRLQDQAGHDDRPGRSGTGRGRQAGAGGRQGDPELCADRAERARTACTCSTSIRPRICSA